MMDYEREPDHRGRASYRSSRHHDDPRGYSRSRSPSDSRDRHRSSRRRSRSRSYDRERDYYPRYYRQSRYRDRPRRENPPPSEVLGVFGLSSFTRESDLEKLFSEYGRVEQVRIIYDRRTDISKGFGFVNFTNLQDATVAKQKLDGLRLHDRCIRVDYSITQHPHNPTPGAYLGKRRPLPPSYSRRSRSPAYDSRRYRSDYGYSR